VALQAFREESLAEDEELRWLWLACHIARALGDDVAWDELTERQVTLARRAGALALLPVALDDRVHVDLFRGRMAVATARAAEADALVEATGSHVTVRGVIALANWRGHDTEALALIEKRRKDVMRSGEGLWLAATDWGSSVRYNGLGRYDDALAAAERAAANPRGMGTPMWLLSDLIEAAVHAGKPERATGPLERLAEIAEVNGTEYSLGVLARSRALLSEGDEADRLFQEGIEHLDRTLIRVAYARTRLIYGEWLRRAGRRVDAREQLRPAHELLTEMGMDAFAERARRELAATGETARKRSVETIDDLTPQETQIAHLAADGQTNPEIGAQLFLSPRTVEWHLRKVFGKLGITSRRELRSALPAGSATAVAV
jgi:DNA-binding CsgD family transcriptional regulator